MIALARSCGRQIPSRAVAALVRMTGRWSNSLLLSADRLVFLKLWEVGVVAMVWEGWIALTLSPPQDWDVIKPQLN